MCHHRRPASSRPRRRVCMAEHDPRRSGRRPLARRHRLRNQQPASGRRSPHRHLRRISTASPTSYMPMPGGNAAVREPWRMAFAHLLAAGLRSRRGDGLDRMLCAQRGADWLRRMIERNLIHPHVEPGPLFDAVAAVVSSRRTVDSGKRRPPSSSRAALRCADDGRLAYEMRSSPATNQQRRTPP